MIYIDTCIQGTYTNYQHVKTRLPSGGLLHRYHRGIIIISMSNKQHYSQIGLIHKPQSYLSIQHTLSYLWRTSSSTSSVSCQQVSVHVEHGHADQAWRDVRNRPPALNTLMSKKEVFNKVDISIKKITQRLNSPYTKHSAREKIETNYTWNKI